MTVLERFFNYITMDTQSDENCNNCPSTEKQKELATVLVEEMKQIGLTGCHMDEKGYVYGWCEATKGLEMRAPIGLISHMDTAPSFCGTGVRPQIIKNYDGNDILLNSEKNIVMSVSDFPNLLNYKGEDLIVTDGTTLLGADDKAGIAEILTALEEIIKSGVPHGRICVAFTPDEEIGRGADYFDIKKFGAEYAYTVDGGALGELEYENFNAAGADIIVHGVNIHPGDAKNKMKNASLIAMEFNGMLPQAEIPAHTEGYEGFYHLCAMEGNEETAKLHYIIRDHDRQKFEKRKELFTKSVEFLNIKYGRDTVVCEMKDSYYNMKEKIEPRMDIIERAAEAFEKCKVSPKVVPIRGGTDGARLSYEG
ncbi:MAG: peptidase T, partial [Thermoflexaceae bacterium]|nr:peptidase T [Thermoflexaceae bacterium]